VDELAAEDAPAPSDGAASWLPGADPSRSSPFAALLLVTYQGYYGGTVEPAGWRVAGYRTVPPGVEPVDPEPETGVALDAVDAHYDVIVVGAGAGGGVAAAELAEAGRRVLIVERALPHRNSELRGNHLQGKGLAHYDVTVGPGAGNPRTFEHLDGTVDVLPGEGDAGAYGLVAMTLGGGTRVWQGMSWRFFPEDFRMASEYGVPPESTLVDWPFGYEELAPYYDRVEWELGVSGDGAGPLGERTPRARGYPMPPMPDTARERCSARRRRISAGGPPRSPSPSTPCRAMDAAPASGARSASDTPALWTRRTAPTTPSSPARCARGTPTC
jgi:choline dehydrogenase-like flavoprotein